MLVVVRNQIIQRETIMYSNEVNAAPWPTSLIIENVRRSTKSPSQGCGGSLPSPEIPHIIPELIVPLRPAGRKFSDLIPAGTTVPGLRDQLHSVQHRVLTTGL